MYFLPRLQPVPPYSTGQSGAIQPFSPSRFSQRTWLSLSSEWFFDCASLARISSSNASAMKARTSSRNASSSSEKARSMGSHAGQVFDGRAAGQHAGEFRPRGLEVVGAAVMGQRVLVLVELEDLVD